MLERMVSQLSGIFDGEQALTSPVVKVLLQRVASQGSGLAGLLSMFRQKGFENHVSSWISQGDNLPISPSEVQQGLGREDLQQIAAQAGVKPETASEQLAQVLPMLIDKLTPEGKLPQENLLQQTMAALAKKV